MEKVKILKKIAQTKTPAPEGAFGRASGEGEPDLAHWQVCWENGVAPKSILVKYKNYKISYHVYWTTGNRLVFWYIKVFYNKNEIAEFDSVEKLEEFLKQRGLPSIKGLPYIGFSEVE